VKVEELTVGTPRSSRVETRSCLVCDGGRVNTGFTPYRIKSENSSDTSDFNVHPKRHTTNGRSGIHEVGILFGILRKLQHWSFSSVIFEYRSFAGPNARFTEEQFIELFDEKNLVLPTNVPTWWTEQEEFFRDVIKSED
jgi:Tyrosine phosphatase family